MPGPRIYNLFPLLAGSVPQWHEHLPRIASMRFDWIFLNPFHAPGFSGSLYAVQDYYRLHPFLQGGSDKPQEELLGDFCRAAREQGMQVMMDLVINHTAKDSFVARDHPDWFVRDAEGKVRSPFAIDPADASKVTVWGDLAEIDYKPRPERRALIEYWRELIRHYIRVGITGFRCDAAYKVPGEVWAELIESARKEGNVTFFAETLGCRLEETRQLANAHFDYFFNSAKWWDFRADWLIEQYNAFRNVAASIAFPESHDTDRLATELNGEGVTDPAEVVAIYKQRYLFAAFFSTGVMMPIGYEYGFRRKLHVVKTRPESFEKPLFDLTSFIAEVNELKAGLPALNEEGPEQRLTASSSPLVGLLRRTNKGSSRALALINPERKETRRIDSTELYSSGGMPHGFYRERTPGSSGTELVPGMAVSVPPLSIRIYEAL